MHGAPGDDGGAGVSVTVAGRGALLLQSVVKIHLLSKTSERREVAGGRESEKELYRIVSPCVRSA